MILRLLTFSQFPPMLSFCVISTYLLLCLTYCSQPYYYYYYYYYCIYF